MAIVDKQHERLVGGPHYVSVQPPLSVNEAERDDEESETQRDELR